MDTTGKIGWMYQSYYNGLGKNEEMSKTKMELKIEFENEINNKLEIDNKFDTYKEKQNKVELIDYINGLKSIIDKLYIISRILNEIKQKNIKKEILDGIEIRIPRNYNTIWNEYIHNIIGKPEMKEKIIQTFNIKQFTNCVNEEDVEILDFLVNIKKINEWSITENEYDEMLSKGVDVEIFKWIVNYTKSKSMITIKTIDILCDLTPTKNNNLIILTHLETYYNRLGKDKFEKMYSEKALTNLIRNRNILVLDWWFKQGYKIKYDSNVLRELVKENSREVVEIIKILRDNKILDGNNNIKMIIMETKTPEVLEEIKKEILQTHFSREMEYFHNLYIKDEKEYILKLKEIVENVKNYYKENTIDIQEDNESIQKIEYLINNYESYFSFSRKITRFENLTKEIDKIINKSNIKTKIGTVQEYMRYISKLLIYPNENFRILSWFNYYDLIDGYYTDYVFIEAFKTNNIFILKWLYDNKYTINVSKEILNYAVEENHIEILKRYIDINKENNKETIFSDNVLKYVKTLKMMKFLVYNRREFKITFKNNILDIFALQDDIECYNILYFIFNTLDYKELNDAYSEQLIDNAILCNNKHVIRWIKEKEQYKSGDIILKYSTNIFDKCLNEEVVLQFLESEKNNFPKIKVKITKELAVIASKYDKVNILEIYSNYKPKTYDFKFDYDEKAVHVAIENNSYNVVNWFIDEYGYKIKINKEWIKEHIDKMNLFNKYIKHSKMVKKIIYLDEKVRILDKLLNMKLKNE